MLYTYFHKIPFLFQSKFTQPPGGNLTGWSNGVWNIVFVGDLNAPSSACGRNPQPYTAVAKTTSIAEKPFITIDAAGKYYIQVPALKQNSAGPEHGIEGATTIPFEKVFVASDTDSAATINGKLAAGLHLVLTPGIYNLTAPILIKTNNQVVLGIGFATLVSSNGTPVIEVAPGVDGVRVGGLLLQAGPTKTDSLFKWGDAASPYKGDPANPGIFYDIFARVGGPEGNIPVSANTMLQIWSSNVIGDNMWLWRADHTDQGSVTDGSNPVANGLQVYGDNVTMYALAVEHTLGDLVKWEGNGGKTYFYQSEYPYDVTAAYGKSGFASYHVDANVTSHNAWGIGVYHFFRDFPVSIPNGIICPTALESSFINPLGVYLSGQGHMNHIINDKG